MRTGAGTEVSRQTVKARSPTSAAKKEVVLAGQTDVDGDSDFAVATYLPT